MVTRAPKTEPLAKQPLPDVTAGSDDKKARAFAKGAKRGTKPATAEGKHKVLLEIPLSLLPAIDAAAEADGRKRHNWIIYTLRKAVEE